MTTRIFSRILEWLSWAGLGLAFPISANFFLTVRSTLLPVLEEIQSGRSLPSITVFFAKLPAQTAMIAAVFGMIVCFGGIYLRRFEVFRQFQVFFISIGWTTVFLFLGSLMIGMIMPFVAVVNGIGMQP